MFQEKMLRFYYFVNINLVNYIFGNHPILPCISVYITKVLNLAIHLLTLNVEIPLA